MKKHFNYILLFLMAFVLFYVPANAQKKKKKAKQTTTKKKAVKSKSKSKKNTVKVVKTAKTAPDTKLDVQYTTRDITNVDSLPEKVVTILSAFKPQLKNIAKIDFVTANERNDTGSVRLDYQVPSQNLSFQYRPIPLVPRSFKMDSVALLQRNTTLKFGYGNYFHHFIELDQYIIDKFNNTHSFNINNESIKGDHHLQSTRSLGLNYLGDYVFSDKGHLLSKFYYQQVGRYRFGLVPDSSTLPFANFKQNSFLTGVSLSWLKTPKNSLRTINYTPNL